MDGDLTKEIIQAAIDILANGDGLGYNPQPIIISPKEHNALSKAAERLGVLREVVYSRRWFDPEVMKVFKEEYEKLK